MPHTRPTNPLPGVFRPVMRPRMSSPSPMLSHVKHAQQKRKGEEKEKNERTIGKKKRAQKKQDEQCYGMFDLWVSDGLLSFSFLFLDLRERNNGEWIIARNQIFVECMGSWHMCNCLYSTSFETLFWSFIIQKMMNDRDLDLENAYSNWNHHKNVLCMETQVPMERTTHWKMEK